MSETLLPDQIVRIWQHKLHEDKVFEDRLHFFLIFESILLAFVSNLLGINIASKVMPLLVAILGFMTSIAWLYVQSKQRYVLEGLKSRCERIIPEYRDSREARRGRRLYRISNTKLLAHGMPALMALVWMVVLLFVVWN